MRAVGRGSSGVGRALTGSAAKMRRGGERFFAAKIFEATLGVLVAVQMTGIIIDEVLVSQSTRRTLLLSVTGESGLAS